MPTRVTQNRGGCCRHFFSFSCGVSICTKRFILAYKLRFSERDKSIREKITKHLISAKILNSESNPSYSNYIENILAATSKKIFSVFQNHILLWNRGGTQFCVTAVSFLYVLYKNSLFLDLFSNHTLISMLGRWKYLMCMDWAQTKDDFFYCVQKSKYSRWFFII